MQAFDDESGRTKADISKQLEEDGNPMTDKPLRTKLDKLAEEGKICTIGGGRGKTLRYWVSPQEEAPENEV